MCTYVHIRVYIYIYIYIYMGLTQSSIYAIIKPFSCLSRVFLFKKLINKGPGYYIVLYYDMIVCYII